MLLGEEDKRKERPRERWSKDWFLQKSVWPSDCHLLNDSWKKERKFPILVINYEWMTTFFKCSFIEKRSHERRNAFSCEIDSYSSVSIATGRTCGDLKFCEFFLKHIVIETCIVIQTRFHRARTSYAADFFIRFEYEGHSISHNSGRILYASIKYRSCSFFLCHGGDNSRVVE